MDEIYACIKKMETDQMNPLGNIEEENELKFIVFTILKLIIPDLNKGLTVNDLLNKFDYDNFSLWSSIDTILEPELKNLNRKVNNILNCLDNKGHTRKYTNSKKKISSLFFNTNSFNYSFQKPTKKIETREKIVDDVVESIDTINRDEGIDLFNYDEMMKFAEEAENLNSNDSESDGSEIGDLDEVEDGQNLRYDDFFAGVINEHAIQLSPNDSKDHFHPSEAIELLVSNQDNEGDFASVDPNLTKLSKLNKDRQKMDSIIDELEENIIKEKEWYKLGESSASDRKKNSLLDIYLEIPQFSNKFNHANIDEFSGNVVPGLEERVGDANNYIVNIVKQRIVDNLFDDVKPKNELLSVIDNHIEKIGSEILVEKSKHSLSEIYSKKYKEQVIGTTSDEYSLEKRQLQELFNDIMHKLDNLSNQYFVTNYLITHGQITTQNIPSLKTEDTIPVIVSDKFRLAPQEIKKQGDLLKRSEMSRQEKRSDRSSLKRRIKNRNKNAHIPKSR
ncbi:Mpp10 protein [Cryptosporidium felis]|nr:Mpp10 protein [Cryptosporidium felis]